MAKHEIPKHNLKFTLWGNLCNFITFLGMGHQKWTEHVIGWLSKNNKICCYINNEPIYFKEIN